MAGGERQGSPIHRRFRESQVIVYHISKDVQSMPQREWSVAHCCGDIFCRAIMVAIEVGEEWNRAYVVLHTTGPCEGCVVG